MDVMNVEQAKIAEAAGACAVMALERIPADIRRDGGVARMSDPAMILEIKNAVTIPVMAKSRIGHFVESQILEACEVDYIDESEVLTMSDEVNHIDKNQFKVPFVCGCRNLGEALRRIPFRSVEASVGRDPYGKTFCRRPPWIPLRRIREHRPVLRHQPPPWL